MGLKVIGALIQALVYLAYYFAMLPSGAVSHSILISHVYKLSGFPKLLYAPESALSVLTATAVAENFDLLKYAIGLHIVCWLAQFYGHGVHEGRAPALLDNLLGGEPASALGL